ncbi:MAG: hypothetical protein LBR79_03430 [Oscillospiraceae bacterium]|nr:hypothetical protein [Oscillospiraceae bacterium]
MAYRKPNETDNRKISCLFLGSCLKIVEIPFSPANQRGRKILSINLTHYPRISGGERYLSINSDHHR